MWHKTSVADSGDHSGSELRAVADIKNQNGGDEWTAVDTGGHKGSEHFKQYHSYNAIKNVFATYSTSLQAIRKCFQDILQIWSIKA